MKKLEVRQLEQTEGGGCYDLFFIQDRMACVVLFSAMPYIRF